MTAVGHVGQSATVRARMSLTCPNGHPALPWYEWCPYCMVKLERPVDDSADGETAIDATLGAALPEPAPAIEPGRDDEGASAVDPPAADNAPETGREQRPVPVSAPDSSREAADGEAAQPQRPSGRWRLVLAGAGAALVIGTAVAVAGSIGGSEGAPPAAVASVPTVPSTAPAPRETSSTSATTAGTATSQPVPTTVAPLSPSVDEPCDPAAAPADSGSLRCVPIRWRDPTAPHVWWPIDEPVPGELVHERTECRHTRGVVTANGSIRNDSDRPRGVVVTIAFLDARGSLVGVASAEVASLPPGAAGSWTVTYEDPTRRVAECHRDGLGFV